MNEQPRNSEALIHEIERYLAAVAVFRTEGCEPTWQPEPSPRVGPVVPRARGACKVTQARAH